MNNGLISLENNLAQANTLTECNKALAQFLKQKGITTYSFTYYAYHPHSANKLKYEMCSDNFKTWHNYYLAQQYNNIDSTLSFVYQNHLPIYWNLKNQLLQANSEAERKMREDSIAFGVKEGLSIPIHGPHNNFAILLLVQMQTQSCRIRELEVQHECLVVAHLYYHYLQSHLLNARKDENPFGITAREIQCLLLLSKQYSVKEMAQTLEVSERTIHFHIQNINRKLGTKNKYQSLAKAIDNSLLTL